METFSCAILYFIENHTVDRWDTVHCHLSGKESSMPLIRMETSVAITKEKKPEIIEKLSKITAEATGKPEQYVMATLSESTICFAGKTGPAAFIDIRSIGSINRKVNNNLCGELKTYLEQSLGISGDRVYINFTDVPGANWGWNGSTFG
jgi:phenylpyruvate tautomerase